MRGSGGSNRTKLMATKAKEGVRLRDKNTSASSGPLTDGRRAPRASITGSPDRDVPKLPEKQTPPYSTMPAARSSTTDLSKSVKPPKAAAVLSRPPVRKPADKPPSPSSSQPQRQHTSQTPKEIRAPKTSSPSPRTSIPSRPIPDKASKTTKSARTPPFTRARSPGNGPIPARRREGNTPTSTATATATANANTATADSEPYASDDSSSIKFEEEETELSIHIEEHDVVDSVDIPLVVKEQVLDDQLMDSPEPPQEESESPKDADVYHVDGSMDDKNDSFEGGETEEKAVVAEDSEAATGEEGDGSKPESTEEKAAAVDVEEEAIVLKPVEVVAAPVVIRPEVRGRKEAQRSNEVIEECKSRLLEKRKNKVLALVGAFETVISLQEPEGQQQGKGGPAAEDGGNATKESA